MKKIVHGFTSKEGAMGYLNLHIELQKIIPYMVEWCDQRKLPFVITSTIRENIEGVSKSNTHPEGRAIDVSVKGWEADKIQEFESHWNKHGFCRSYGAISKEDGNPRLVLFHNGVGYHLHIQVKA
jgi:hypothetical protein